MRLSCARILLSVLRTLLHGAFQWLQPRSPVVQEVAERERAALPDAKAEAHGSVRVDEAPEAVVNRRHAALVVANPRRVARLAVSHPRVNRAVALPVALREARVADVRAVRASVLAPVVSLQWRASSALQAASFTRRRILANALSTLSRNSFRIAFSFAAVRQPPRYLAAAVAERRS